jgi:hypothetical protein
MTPPRRDHIRAHFLAFAFKAFAKRVEAIMIGTRSSIVMTVIMVVASLLVSVNGARLGNAARTGITPVYQRSVKAVATTKIIGGKIAAEYRSFGFSAGNQLCGGTLIHDDFFLTAARK